MLGREVHVMPAVHYRDVQRELRELLRDQALTLIVDRMSGLGRLETKEAGAWWVEMGVRDRWKHNTIV